METRVKGAPVLRMSGVQSDPSPAAPSASHKAETAPAMGMSPNAPPRREARLVADPYDALTDLFLGEVAPTKVHSLRSGPDPRHHARAAQAGVELNSSAGSGSARTPAATDSRDAQPRVRRVADAHEVLSEPLAIRRPLSQEKPEARGEMKSSTADDAGERTDHGQTVIEGLVLGHLPVLGTVWAMQYAREIAARENRHVGMIRVEAGMCTLELVGPPGAPAARVESVGGSLGAALRTMSRATNRWIIRLDELSEHELIDLTDIDALTLLTGCDEAAMAAAFRMIKGLSRSGSRQGGRELRLAVMGSDQARAGGAVEKLLHATRTVLGMELARVDYVPRISSTKPGRPLHASPGDRSVGDILHELRTAAGSGRPAERPIVESELEVSRGVTAAPAPGSDLETTLILAANVPGLRPIAARCPYAPKVGLALDPAGRAHLLAMTCAAEDEASMTRSLLTARDWLQDHFELVRLTLPPGLPLDASAPATFRLFTNDGRAVTRLLRLGMRVHLAMPGADDSGLGVARYVEVS